MTIKNLFGYSISRNNVRKECLRRYFYQYYFHWNGWLIKESIKKELDETFGPLDPSSKIRKKMAYTFKKSTGKYLYVGNKIHSQIEHLLLLLKKGAVLTKGQQKKFADMAVAKFQEELDEILKNQKREEFLVKPKDNVFFIEYLNSSQFSHGFSNLIAPNWTRFSMDLTDLFEVNMRAFFDTGLYNGLHFLFKRSGIADIEPNYIYTYEFKQDGNRYKIPIQVRPDLLTVSDGVMGVFDWKTGSSRNIKFFQLQYYAFMLLKMHKEGKIFQDQEINEVKLKIYCLKESKPIIQDYEDGCFDIEAMHQDFIEMMDITDDGIDSNVVANSREEEFPCKRDSGMFGCRACPFLHICPGTAQELNFS
jgi:hypothetical protein